MPFTEPIPSTLDDRGRDVTGAALQATLVDLLDLSLVAKQAHWNLVGRQFRDIHLHLDELVTTTRTFSDQVAERAAAIGVSPDGRAGTVAAGTGVPSFPEGWVRDREVVQRVFEAVDAVVRRLRPRMEEVGKADPVTEDLLIQIVGSLEEARWMWQAQNAGYQSE
ncbi:MAG TPA: DNA starvation/stationary phase protection protein [Pseudonocardia sp.]|nr:DNA starvation/stationary phase protection protein [Pseudonocardia sp.]